jgi:hypothetical protein
MKNHYLIIAVLFAACQIPQTKSGLLPKQTTTTTTAQPNTLTEAEKAEGWQLLFDGETTRGWHVYLNKTSGSAWKTFDGMLHLDPTDANGGDLVTDEEYENFHLSLEWKIADRGSSGILVCVQEDSSFIESWFTGPEMQVIDNAGHPDAHIASHRAGDLYDIISGAKETVNRPGKWNTADIRIENGQLDFFLNNEHLIDVKIGSGEWNWLVSESKFRDIPDFGKITRGRIVLQDHRSPVWFRNIKIRKL